MSIDPLQADDTATNNEKKMNPKTSQVLLNNRDFGCDSANNLRFPPDKLSSQHGEIQHMASIQEEISCLGPV